MEKKKIIRKLRLGPFFPDRPNSISPCDASPPEKFTAQPTASPSPRSLLPRVLFTSGHLRALALILHSGHRLVDPFCHPAARATGSESVAVRGGVAWWALHPRDPRDYWVRWGGLPIAFPSLPKVISVAGSSFSPGLLSWTELLAVDGAWELAMTAPFSARTRPPTYLCEPRSAGVPRTIMVSCTRSWAPPHLAASPAPPWLRH
jgi:hypothetical protein